MAYLLGVDTGGTYTDAVILDDDANAVIASAKSLTTRPDLSLGIGQAIDTAMTSAGVTGADIAMVSLSTTLATNALVEGQGGKVALVAIGFQSNELQRAGLGDALGDDPVILLAGGHNHSGTEAAELDIDALDAAISDLDQDISGFAVAASFATRNPEHETIVKDFIRAKTGKPVTCSHELSQALGGPKRALTAVLNARLIGMIDGLITSCETHLRKIGIEARLMVVRGDGALVSAKVAREKPIETILSGPAASISGASWLTGEADALVSDIGGTTTDVCLLSGGRPKIDPQGAQVGPYRTMVEAVAMRTTGLGGDSEVHLGEGLSGGLFLGPRRLLPISLAAVSHPTLVHDVLDRALAVDLPPPDGARIAIPMWSEWPKGLSGREAIVAKRLGEGPLRVSHAVTTRMENPALQKLVSRGLVMIAGVTPSDASHVLGTATAWDKEAAGKALALFARRRIGSGEKFAASGEVAAQLIVDQLTIQTADCLLRAAFAEDGWEQPADQLARHPLTFAGISSHRGIIEMDLRLGVPVIGLGASAHCYYGAVGERLNTPMILPKYAEVANAIGAVVGQVAMRASGTVTSSGAGVFTTNLPDGLARFDIAADAMDRLEDVLREQAGNEAKAAGVEEIHFIVSRDIKEAIVENQPMFIEAQIKVVAQGRPRIATG